MPKFEKNTRKCRACNEHASKDEMLRFVKTKDGKIYLDKSKKADGRGVWVHDTAECKEKLKNKNLLSSAFKTHVDSDVYDGL